MNRKSYLSGSMAGMFLALALMLASCRTEVFVRELPDRYVVRATGTNGYTAVLDRKDGHLHALTVGAGETFADQPLAVVTSTVAPLPPTEKRFIEMRRGTNAIIGAPLRAGLNGRRHGKTLVFSGTMADGSVLTYRCEPRRLGISLSGAEAVLTLRWNSRALLYTVGDRVIFGHLEEPAEEDARQVLYHPVGSEAVLTLTPPPGKMKLGIEAQFPLAAEPFWIAARPSVSEDDLAALRLVAFRYYDADEAPSRLPHLSGPVGYALFDTLLLAPGEALRARFQAFAPQSFTKRFAAPRAAVFALNITESDPQLIREGRVRGMGLGPNVFPTLMPVRWQALPTQCSNGVVTADTLNLTAGVYRVRIAIADKSDPRLIPEASSAPTNAGCYADDAYVVVSASPHSLDVVTEQNRQAYFRGESVPAALVLRSRAVLSSGRARVTLRRGEEDVLGTLPERTATTAHGPPKDEEMSHLTSGGSRSVATVSSVANASQNAGIATPGDIAVPTVANATRRIPFRVETADLAPGVYTLTCAYAGMNAACALEIVEPAGESVIAISENQMGGCPFAGTRMGSPFGGQPVDSLAHALAAPYADLQVTSFREEMGSSPSYLYNARLADTLELLRSGPASERIAVYDLRRLWMDGMVRQRMGYWQGVQGRGLSFSKANTLPGTEEALRRHLVNISQDYRAFGNYFGPQVDVDCGALASQLAYTGIPDEMTAAFNDRLAKAQDALFRAEYRGELAATNADAARLSHLRAEWYREVWPRTDAKDRAALALLDPTLSITANREYHHNVVANGQYAPSLYRELDLTQVEAWADAMDNVLFADSWANLAAAARRANRRPDRPIWIETQAFPSDILGDMQKRWWGVLANGADGVGYAANVFGLRQYSAIEPHQPTFRRQTAAAFARMVRTLGPTIRTLERERRVALLFSKHEADYKPDGYAYNLHCFRNYPPFVSFFALAMAGYQPDLILDEQISMGELDRYQVLYLTWQHYPMDPAVKAKVDDFVAKGGKIVMDAASLAEDCPGAVRVAVEPRGYKGPTNYGSPEDWAWIETNVPKLRAALDPLLTPLPGRIAHPRCTTYWFKAGKEAPLTNEASVKSRMVATERDPPFREQAVFKGGGPRSVVADLSEGDAHVASDVHGGGARYVIVINEGSDPLKTTLTLAKPMGGYDLLTGARIEPTAELPVDFRNTVARLYAFTPSPIGGIAVRAVTNAVAGAAIGISAALLADGGATSAVVAPAVIRITGPDGALRWEKWIPMGGDSLPVVWNTAATDSPGRYGVVVKELLSGKTAAFSITLKAGTKLPSAIVAEPDESVAVAPLDRRALGQLWHTKDAAWSVIVDAAQPHRLDRAQALVKALNRRGLKADIWQTPETIRMPVGYLFTPEEQLARDRVFSGEAIGERYYLHGWDGDKKAPNVETWESRGGTAIYRNIVVLGEPGESSLLDRFGPQPGEGGAIRVGIREFSGDHDAVFLTAWNDEALARTIQFALAVRPSEAPIGPEAGRQAFKEGYLLGAQEDVEKSFWARPSASLRNENAGHNAHSEGHASSWPSHAADPTLPPAETRAGQTAIDWAEQLGRSVMQLHVSTNGRYILAQQCAGRTVMNGIFAADGTVARVFARLPEEAEGAAVRGVDDTGALILESGKKTRRTLSLDGRLGPEQPVPPFWQSADGRQTLRYESRTNAVEEGTSNGQIKTKEVVLRKLVRYAEGKAVFESETLGALPDGRLRPSPHGKYLLQTSNEGDKSLAAEGWIGQRVATLYDGLTGKAIWSKAGWWLYVVAWSRDGEYLAVTRQYQNVDYFGIHPTLQTRCTILLVRAADGAVMAEGFPTTWVGSLQIAADNRAVVGFPAYMADHYWLLRAGEGLKKVTASSRWLYAATLDGDGREVITLDMDGILRRHQLDGDVLWKSAVFQRPWGAELGLLAPLEKDILLGSTAGRLYRVNGANGAVQWSRTITEYLAE